MIALKPRVSAPRSYRSRRHGKRGVPWCGFAVVLLFFLSAASAVTASPRLREIRCLGGRDYSRLVLDLSEAVEYRLRRIAASADSPPQIYVDLLGAQSAQQSYPLNCTRKGPLTSLQVVNTDRGLRVVMQAPGLTATRAFPLLDPFRLVVDVEAVAPRPAAPPALPTPALSARARRRAPLPPPSEELATARVKILLDPGHGGDDPGALGVGGIQEKDVVLAIALQLRQMLSEIPGLEVVLTRDGDFFLSLEERTAVANAERADLFISIHANASVNSASSGIETYYLSNTNDRATLRLAAMENGLRSVTGRNRHDRDIAVLLSSLIQNYKVAESAALAENIHRGIIKAVGAGRPGVVDLGVKQGPFYVLVGAAMPCVLVEVSFLTHREEGALLGQASYRDTIAAGLRDGIRDFISTRRIGNTL